jgi:hypothetical protein
MNERRFDHAVVTVVRVGTRRGVLAVLAGAVGAIGGWGGAALAGKRCRNRYSEREIERIIVRAAKKHKQRPKAMLRVARCESNLDPCAYNPSGPYLGLFQFLKGTFKNTKYGDRDIWDPEANALAAASMWERGDKDQWACR